MSRRAGSSSGRPGPSQGASGALAGVAAVLSMLTLLLLLVTEAPAYNRYTPPNPIYTSCFTCHGDFRASPYTSLKDGGSWASGLHQVHSSGMLGDDCNACHWSSQFNPVFIGHSNGGAGMDPLGCSGCHGRSQDGFAEGTTMGYAYGLRILHWNANRWVNGVHTRECYDCHPDSAPAWEPASEYLLPPYYASPGTGHPGIPSSPCNPQPEAAEDLAGGPTGLDNDGDGQADGADPDCVPGPDTPGEASGAGQLRATGYDPDSGLVSLTYDPACAATDHHVFMGPLSQVATYGWSDAACSLGTSGSAVFDPGAGSVFFVIVGSSPEGDGPYGRGRLRNTALYPRPPFTGNPCGTTQNLIRRCD